MGQIRTITLHDGDMIRVELIVPSNYKYDNEERNEFIQGFDTGTASDREVERAIRKGWVRKI